MSEEDKAFFREKRLEEIRKEVQNTLKDKDITLEHLDEKRLRFSFATDLKTVPNKDFEKRVK